MYPTSAQDYISSSHYEVRKVKVNRGATKKIKLEFSIFVVRRTTEKSFKCLLIICLVVKKKIRFVSFIFNEFLREIRETKQIRRYTELELEKYSNLNISDCRDLIINFERFARVSGKLETSEMRQ